MQERGRVRSELKAMLGDIIRGMEFPQDSKEWFNAILSELKVRLGPDADQLLREDGDVIRELDFFFLEASALFHLLQKIYGNIDPEVRKKFPNRRVGEKAVIEEFVLRLVSH